MNKKLLHKTARIYLLYAVSILLAVAPFFYYVTEQLYVRDADEALILQKNEFLQFTLPNLKQKDISIWNNFNRDVKIELDKSIHSDTLFFKNYYDKLSNENEPYRELNSPIIIEGTAYTYSSKINLVESEDLIINIALLFTVVIILLLIGLYFINRKLSLNLWKPFYNTINQIEQFEVDKSHKPNFLKTNIEEFNQLNQSISNLIHKNIAIFKNQREFVENAAHELQTPLAIFQGKLDVLMQREDITQEQATILFSLNNSVANLKRLNKNLLLLSKIENNSFSDTENLMINAAVKKNLSFFKEQAESQNITIALNLETECMVKSNSVLFEILISNLFLNAIRHNILNGEITISINQHSFCFSNTGKKESLFSNKLFQRFSKTNSSKQGNGLGLAIVKKIVELNGWKISYSFAKNQHSFLVTF